MTELHADATEVKVVAAIDVGANSIRMEVAEVAPDGGIKVLEKLQRTVRLGQDTFRRGRLTGTTMRAAVSILRDFRRVLGQYQIERLRAVATSAVREATNADTFLDRIYMATGLDVEVIPTMEESRVTVSSVLEALRGTVDLSRGQALIADVGGGNTLLTVLRRGKISASQAVRLGSVRLQESLAIMNESPEGAAAVLRNQIRNVLDSVEASMPLGKIRVMIAVGADARFVAAQVGRGGEDQAVTGVPKTGFRSLVRKCVKHKAEELAAKYELPFADAETLVPALLVYRALLDDTGAQQIMVPRVSMRDGLILDLARSAAGAEDATFAEGVVQSALAVAEKYHVDVSHATNVAEMAVRQFDALQAEHGLTARHRLLLHVAALVHETGSYISNRAHHKHSHYLVTHSELFGLRREELAVVALVARYHRRACPKPTHPEYMGLPRDQRMVVSKLAAMLRVADALDRGHGQPARGIRCEPVGEEFVIHVAGAADLSLERRTAEAKADLFQDVFGLRVRLEPDPDASPERRARAVE